MVSDQVVVNYELEIQIPFVLTTRIQLHFHLFHFNIFWEDCLSAGVLRGPRV